MTAAKFRARLDRTDAIRQRGTLAIVTVGFAYAIADCAIRDPWGTLRAAYWPGVVFGSNTGTAWRPQHRGLGAAPLFLDVPRERSVNE